VNEDEVILDLMDDVLEEIKWGRQWC
jgi:hypothetical protein